MPTPATLRHSCQQLYIRAYLSGAPLVIPCQHKAEAHKLRFTAYNSVKHIRAALKLSEDCPDDIPQDLWEAVKVTTLQIEGAALTFNPTDSGQLLATVEKVLAGETSSTAAPAAPLDALTARIKALAETAQAEPVRKANSKYGF